VIILASANHNKQMIEENFNKQYSKLKNKDIKYAESSAHFIMFDSFDWFIKEVSKALNS
jgi:hypothetical protein